MALTKGFIHAAGATALDTRKADEGKVVANSDGTPRTGVLTSNPSIVTSDASTAPMRVAVAKSVFATQRATGDGVAFWSNDGSVFVTVTKPGSNSWYVVIWAKHNDVASGDLVNTPELGVTTGSAAASPTVPSIPAGTEEVARILIPSSATSTQSGGVVITNTYRMTAMRGGAAPVRNTTELAAFAAADGTLAYLIDVDAVLVRRDGAWSGVSFKRQYTLDLPDAGVGLEYGNLQAIASVALPALPFAYRVMVNIAGVIGFAPSAADHGLNVTASAGTITDTQGNQQIRIGESAKWYPYARVVQVNVPANTATTIGVSFSTPGANGHFKGLADLRLFALGEY